MIHIAIAGGNGPGGAAKGRIPNFFFKKKGTGRASRERPCVSAFRAKITARCAVFSSDLTSMSKNEHWLLVFMALGANLKISIFDPPSVGGTYLLHSIRQGPHFYQFQLLKLIYLYIKRYLIRAILLCYSYFFNKKCFVLTPISVIVMFFQYEITLKTRVKNTISSTECGLQTPASVYRHSPG